MYEIQSQEEYDAFVQQLADEHAASVDNHAADDVANGVLTSFTDDGVVQRCAEVYGARIETTDGETVSPYDVLQWTARNVSEFQVPGDKADDTTALLATYVLARDMTHARDAW